MNTTLSNLTRHYDSPGEDVFPQSIHAGPETGPVRLRQASLADLGAALAAGVADWRACRTDVIVMVGLYPLAALFIAAVCINNALLPFVFPVCAGAALIAPVASMWFAALSRQRERDGVATSEAAAAIFDSPRLHTLQRLGALLLVLFAAWIVVAGAIFALTVGKLPGNPPFLASVFGTSAGAEMIVAGVLVGAVFAVVTLGICFIGLPLALDREISTGAAIRTSLQAALANPVVALGWGALVVVGLIIGAIPGLLGLAVVLPVLGHTSWHLYRRLAD